MNTTESAATRYAGVETWPTEDMVTTMIEGQLAAVAALQGAAGALATAIDAVAARLRTGGRLIYLGAGTSGRIAVQDAAELLPTFGWPQDRALALMAGGESALLRAVEGAEDDEPAAIAALDAAGMGAQDAVIGVAASGRTPFVVAGLRHAGAKGALTVGLFNNPGATLESVCTHPVLLPTGAEIVAGSTRMKAGTAQKAALNILSTGVFLRLGHVWRGRMVEMEPTNDKLRARAVEMVAELADAPPEAARRALAEGGTIKHAIVMLARGLDRTGADRLLAEAGGRLHLALAAPA
ncbi:MAG: N-acetylmuramic acid 6-phosphate etherase MurQ [Rhodobacteraceae bacterium HLUCCA12]|nr:MAG: N-acetylmuramic acid 6-phosphate etherase MurQ [Rhodobacteraceae bacterium HLUCCA12]